MPDFRFNLPTQGQLTAEQKIALFSINPIMVWGGPGSGKTVVSVLRLKKLAQSKENVKLFTFNRTLMAAIKGLAKSENFDSGIVDSFYDWYYDKTKGIFENDSLEQISIRFATYTTQNGGKYGEILVDEAQDFEYKIMKSLNSLSKKISCGADRDQDIRNNYENNADEQIGTILRGFHELTNQPLGTNFRNTKEIFAFARKFVPNNPRPHRINLATLPVGDKPEVYFGQKPEDQLKLIEEIVSLNQNDSNIGILVHFTYQVDIIRKYLRAKKIEHSYYYNEMSKSDREETENNLKSPLITTYASCKGLEFDIVILPLFDCIDSALEKGTTTPNHYYVAATRSRRQLFLFCWKEAKIFSNFDSSLYKLNR